MPASCTRQLSSSKARPDGLDLHAPAFDAAEAAGHGGLAHAACTCSYCQAAANPVCASMNKHITAGLACMGVHRLAQVALSDSVAPE